MNPFRAKSWQAASTPRPGSPLRELYLNRYGEADAHATRALAEGRVTGQGELFLVLVQILVRVWFVRGKLANAGSPCRRSTRRPDFSYTLNMGQPP